MNRYTFPDEMRAALEGLPQPFAIYQFIDGQVVALLVSDGFCKLFGYADRERAIRMMNHDLYVNAHPDDAGRIANAALRFAEGGDDEEYEALFRTKAGVESDWRVIHAHGRHVCPRAGIRVSHVWYMDEGMYREGDEFAGSRINRELNGILREESILRAVNYDALTGLPNLAHFFKQCEARKAKLQSEGKQACLLYIDLNGMKYYNHRNGFTAGDALLKAYAGIMAQVFGREHCCHIGADRFAVSSPEDGLEDRLRRFFDEIDRIEDRLPVRVGVYSAAMEDVPSGTAYDRAKMACDVIRKSDSSGFHYYTAELSDAARRRQYIQTNIDRAISEGWIKVYFQAIVRAVNEKICDEEALARWIDPELGFLSPAEFIPELEESGQIYKLDLYVLEQVLKKIRLQQQAGLSVVAHSINLSRSDFEACDIVEEIRRRVDDAGVRRDLITIEITESIIGSSYEFMRSQVERFQRLGFPVWMDDFGSGYSSLDVLQSIRFDLLKFDMSFMRKLDESDNGKIILTDMMKMATSLGVDTICEGVETEQQVRFLQEIGCSKLQGYYFCRPIPLEQSIENNRKGLPIGYENPKESAYYEAIGRINLYDLAVIDTEDDPALQNAFNMLPMGILEINSGKARYVRSNQAYRDFMVRFFGVDVKRHTVDSGGEAIELTTAFMRMVKQCCDESSRAFFDEIMPNGSKVHTFVRRVGVNPVTGSMAVAIAVLSIREPNEGLLFEQVLSVIEQFGEHMPGGFFIYRADEGEELLYANKAVCDIFGCDSLDEFKALTGFTFRGMVHPDDYDRISASIVDQVQQSSSDLDFVEYRIIRKDGEVRWLDDYGHYMEYDGHNGLYYVFISDITDKHMQAESDKALRAAVIEALTKAYDSVWLIRDITTEHFELFRVDEEMEHLMPANVAVKISTYSQAFAFYSRLVLEEDRQRFLESVTAGNIVRNTADKLLYSVPFRRVFEDGIRYYRLEFTRLDLPNGTTGIVGGFKNVDDEVRRDQQVQRSLGMRAAVIEALTRPYDSVWLITDVETQSFELYRIDEKLAHLMPAREALKITRFSDAFAFYSRLVLEEDRQSFLEAVTAENIVRNTEDKPIYSVPFRRVFEDGVRYYRLEFSRLSLLDGKNGIVGGFKDVDEEMRKGLELQQHGSRMNA